MSNDDAQIIDRARELTGASRYAFAKAATLEAAKRVVLEVDRKKA